MHDNNAAHWLRITFVFALIGAFTLRLMAVLILGVADIPSYSENGQIAVNLVAGDGYIFNFYGLRSENPLRTFVPPLYSGIVWFALIQPFNTATVLGGIHAVLSTLAIVAIFYFTLSLSANRLVALAVAIGVAFHPVYILSIIRPHTLVLNLLLIALFLWVSSKLQAKETYGWATITGVSLALAIYSRSMYIGMLPILLLWLWLNSAAGSIKILKLGGVITTALVVVLLPWLIYTYRTHHQFVFMATNGGFNFWIGNNSFTTGSGMEVYTDRAREFMGVPPDDAQPVIQEMYVYPMPSQIAAQIKTLSEVELDRQFYQAGWDFIQNHPDQALSLFLTKLKSFVWFRTNVGQRYDASWIQPYKYLYALLLMPFVLGLALSIPQWRRYSLLYMIFGYYTLFYTYFHVQTRYRWEIEAYMLVFVALALHWLGRRLGYLPLTSIPPT